MRRNRTIYKFVSHTRFLKSFRKYNTSQYFDYFSISRTFYKIIDRFILRNYDYRIPRPIFKDSFTFSQYPSKSWDFSTLMKLSRYASAFEGTMARCPSRGSHIRRLTISSATNSRSHTWLLWNGFPSISPFAYSPTS